MLPDDQDVFLRFVQERDPVAVGARDSDSAIIEPIADLNIDRDKTLCLWNRKILPSLEREWVPSPGYFTVSESKMPILEFTSSFTATWEGKPALGQGRLYGIFEGKPPEFEKWYESLVRWLRTNYEKNPTGTGGYVGPAAYEFYKSGGYLLPNILPPRTKEWLTAIGRQHARPRTPLQSSKRAKARS